MRVSSPEKISKWNQLIQEQKSSALTVKDFCKQKKVSSSCFHKWKHRFNSDKSLQESNVILADITDNVTSLKNCVRNTDSITEEQSKPIFEITFPNKATMRIEGNISSTNLEMLLKVVSQC